MGNELMRHGLFLQKSKALESRSPESWSHESISHESWFYPLPNSVYPLFTKTKYSV